MILDELNELVAGKIRKGFRISRVCISLCYTGVMLDNGYVGLCSTPTEDIGHPHLARKLDFHGSDALEVARLANSFNMIERAVGVAAINALSQYLMDSEGYDRQLGVDILNALDLRGNDNVAVVGYMRPLVEKLKGVAREVHVFERNPQLRGDALPDTFVESILPKKDVVIISGSSLVNGTLDRLLDLSKGARSVAVAGPTASTLPEPLFKRGAKILAGVRAKGHEVLDAVAEAKPFAAFKKLVEKYVLISG